MVAREAPVLVIGTCRSFDFLLTPPGTGVAMLERLLPRTPLLASSTPSRASLAVNEYESVHVSCQTWSQRVGYELTC